MDNHYGIIGDIVENGENGGVYSIDWKIGDFSNLSNDRYQSRHFTYDSERWILRLFTNGSAWNTSPENCVDIALIRLDGRQPKTYHVTLGIRGSEGVENKKEIGQEFSEEDSECWWVKFCGRVKLEKNASRLMPRNELVIRCDMRCGGPSIPKVYVNASAQTDGEFNAADVPTKDRKSSKKQGKLPSEVLVIYPFKEVEKETQNFSEKPLRDGGCKIGEGAFGTVYRAVVRGVVVAVKKLKDPVDSQFITELKTLTSYKHENLLPLLACSLGPTSCLLYEYLPNGSLQDRLAPDDGSEPLSWQTRLSISYGTARGINHLHTFADKPMVHRDIKSGNILLGENFVPKVGDFGLVRTGSSGDSSIVAVTERFCGTYVYMPREAFMGDVSVKWDTFSFGVVLLELLTGLPPYDRNRKNRDLNSHMENCRDILPRLDPTAEWNEEAATELYGITQRCVQESKKSRPHIAEILEDLKELSLLR